MLPKHFQCLSLLCGEMTQEHRTAEGGFDWNRSRKIKLEKLNLKWRECKTKLQKCFPEIHDERYHKKNEEQKTRNSLETFSLNAEIKSFIR